MTDQVSCKTLMYLWVLADSLRKFENYRFKVFDFVSEMDSTYTIHDSCVPILTENFSVCTVYTRDEVNIGHSYPMDTGHIS